MPPTKALNPLAIRQQLHLSQERMSHLLHVSAKTLWRWENHQAVPPSAVQQSLSNLKSIADLAEKIYTPEGIETFLSTPMAEFDHLSAYELLMLGKYEPVMAALAADYEGLGY
jgi:transcriptional regulator with XRE-family HTH domain